MWYTFFKNKKGSFNLKRKPLCQEKLNAIYSGADQLFCIKEKIIQFVDHILLLGSKLRKH